VEVSVEVSMKKALLLIVAAAIAGAAGLSPAAAAETPGVPPMAIENAGRSYAADVRPERRAYRTAQRVSHYPYYRRYASGADPWWPGSGPRCSYGSYVACVYTNAFCWQRCY
jgi:hypothetical protein